MEEVFFRHRKPLVQRPKTERGAVCSGDSRGAYVARALGQGHGRRVQKVGRQGPEPSPTGS